jgi:glycosyltransferase involved in cell wall biosynthesis
MILQHLYKKKLQPQVFSVLFDHEVFLMQPAGGITRYFIELIRQLSSEHNEYRCTVFAGLHASEMLKQQRPSIRANIIGWKLPFNIRHNRAVSLFNQIIFRAFMMSTRPDIYHSTYYRPNQTPHQTATVVTIHDMIAELFPVGGNDPTPQRKLCTLLSANRIICVSHNTRQDLLRLYPAFENKVSVVHHGASIPAGAPLQRLIEKPYFLYVGTRESRKNTAMLKQAFLRAEIAGTQLVFFGGRAPGPHELESMHSGRCIFMSGDDNTLASLYAHATALLYPSLYEGFGMPILEAMRYGCPVVASNTSSMPEVAGDAALLISPHDQFAWTQAIRSLSCDQSLRKSLACLGRAHSELLTWVKCANETAQAYSLAILARGQNTTSG